MSNKVYARVVDGKVAEYPVFELHIHNRAHPIEWYTPVQYDERPEVPEYHTLKETVSVRGDQVIARFTVEPISLNALLRTIHLPTPGVILAPGERPTAPAYSSLPQALVDRIKALANEYVEEKLLKFVKEKDYRSIESIASYANSSIAAYKADAVKFIDVQDRTWVAFYAYFDSVARGEKPVPESTDDIDAQLPEMTWN